MWKFKWQVAYRLRLAWRGRLSLAALSLSRVTCSSPIARRLLSCQIDAAYEITASHFMWILKKPAGNLRTKLVLFGIKVVFFRLRRTAVVELCQGKRRDNLCRVTTRGHRSVQARWQEQHWGRTVAAAGKAHHSSSARCRGVVRRENTLVYNLVMWSRESALIS